jgi:hypothetical protein
MFLFYFKIDRQLMISISFIVKKVFRCRECNFECRIQSMLENHLFYSDHEYTQETKEATETSSIFSSAELAQVRSKIEGVPAFTS